MNFEFQVQTFIPNRWPVDVNHFWNIEKKNFQRILSGVTFQNAQKCQSKTIPISSVAQIVRNVVNN